MKYIKTIFLFVSIIINLGCVKTSFVNIISSSSNESYVDIYSSLSHSGRQFLLSEFRGQGHTATVLSDERVVIAGGSGSGAETKSVEIYNPATDISIPAKDMNVARSFHTATLLNDGKVLVIGGQNGSVIGSLLNSVEIYDPALNTWTVKTSIPVALTNHTATLLADGTVLVIGGVSGLGPLNTVYLYHPTTNVWELKNPMIENRHLHTATLLPNGLIVVIGGVASIIEIYNPALNSWSTAATLTDGRRGHSTVLLPSGNLFVSQATLSAAAAPEEQFGIYDPDLDAWSVISSPYPVPIDENSGMSAVLLSNGLVMISGGRLQYPSPPTYIMPQLKTAFTYNPGTSAWTQLPDMNEIRMQHTSSVLSAGGNILMVGGTGSPSSLSNIEIYNVLSNSWRTFTAGAEKRMLHTATSFSNGTEVVAIGGDNGPTIHNTVEIYNSVTNLWTTLTSMSMARTGHAATLIDNDKVVVTGGYVGAGVTATSVEIFDKNAMTPTPLWTTVTPMLAPRMYHTAHAETNSHGIFVIGGATGSLMFTNTVERYDIDLNTWSSKASMTNVRFGHQSIMLPETDNIIVIGGVSTPGGVGNVELYNNSLDSWSTKASMSFAARSNHTATLLQDGRILVTGGVGGAVTSPSTSVEAYNPATDTWQTLAPMNYGREFHTATLLSDGRLLVAGGNSEITKSVEIYDPILNRWTLQQNMMDGRYLHTASLLSDDKILLYGGLGAYDRLWSWEILFKNTILVP